MTKEPTTDPEGEGLADDLIGSDPIPDDARRFDENGHAIPGQNTEEPDPDPEESEPDPE